MRIHRGHLLSYLINTAANKPAAFFLYLFLLVLTGCSSGGDGGGDNNDGNNNITDTSKPGLSTSNPLSPVNNASNVSISTSVSISFNEAIDTNTLTNSSFMVTGIGPVAGTISYNDSTDTATFIPDSILLYGTTYTASITTAVTDLAGNAIEQSHSWSFTTEAAPGSGDTTPPAIPGTPTDSGQYSISATVIFRWTTSFDAETGVTGYRLQIGTSPGAADVFDDNIGNTLFYYFTGSSGQTLYARVSAVNGDGLQSDWSASSDGITLDTTSPETPTAPTDAGEYVESNNVIFNWVPAIDPESGISSYSIYIYSSTGTFLNSAIVGNQTTYTYTGTTGQTIKARISATNGAGRPSNFSDLSDGITILGPVNSPVVTGPASPAGITTPAWVWTSGGGGAGVYRYKLNDADLSVGATGTNNNFFAQTTALADGTYTLYVQEQNSIGTWSTSGSYTLTIDSSLSVGDTRWTRQFGSVLKDEATNMTTDTEGNLYVIGSTQGDLVGTELTGSADGFLAKYDSQGNRIWIVQYGATSSVTPKAVVVDSAGNSYITGRVVGALPGVTATASDYLYIIKFDANGDRTWAIQYGTSSSDSSNGIALDSVGNIYTVGTKQGTDAGPGGFPVSDIFVNKFDSTGSQLWSQRLNSTNHDFGDAIAVDNSDNIVITGSWNTLPTALIVKFDSDGNQLWFRTTGGFIAGGNDIAIDEQGNSYITGGESDDLFLATRNGFVTKYDTGGNRLWYRSFGVAGNDSGSRITVDNLGNSYITGTTEGNLTGTGHLGGVDIIVAKYKSNGDLVWDKQLGTASSDAGSGIALGPDETVYIAGYSEGGLSGNINLNSRDIILLSTLPPPLSNADLTGSYLVNGQQTDLAVASTEIWSWAAKMTFDGAGNCTSTGTHERGVRRQDTVTPRTLDLFIGTPDNGLCTYSLAGDGALTINGINTYAVSRDMTTIVGVSSAGVVESMVKESSGGLTNASLNGTYLLNGQTTTLTPTSTEASTWIDRITFDGAGTCHYVGTYEEGIFRTDNITPRTIGVTAGTPDNGNCTYALAGNGTLTLNGSDTYAVSPDANTIIGINAFADTTVAFSTYEAMVKQSNITLTNASLTGQYHNIGQSTELTATSTEAWSWVGNLSFDGAGNCNYAGTYEQGSIRTDDVTPRTTSIFIGTPDNQSCTYSLASDGTLTIKGAPTYSYNPETGNIIGIGTLSSAGLAGSFFERLVK